MSEVPELLERSLKHEVENNILVSQCSVLKGRLEIVKRSIANERDKQQALRARLTALRNGVRSASSSPPRSDCASTSQDAFATAESPSNDQSIGSMISDGSPISLKSKRKGMFIEDDAKIVKRLKMFG